MRAVQDRERGAESEVVTQLVESSRMDDLLLKIREVHDRAGLGRDIDQLKPWPYLLQDDGQVRWVLVDATCLACGEDTQGTFFSDVDDHGTTWFHFIVHSDSEGGTCAPMRVETSRAVQEPTDDPSGPHQGGE